MKTVMLVLIISVLGGAGFWYITENNRKDRAEALARQEVERQREEARLEKQLAEKKAEDERIRKERMTAVAKDDAVRLFLKYLSSEEERLKEEVEEAKIELEKIGVDRDSLSNELKAIEEANAARVASVTKRHEQQRDKIERVLAIMRSPVLNRLAREYCRGDLSALRSEFEAEVQRIKDVDDRYLSRQIQINARYEETVKDANSIVDRKLKAARAKYENVGKELVKNAQNLKRDKDRLAAIERELEQIDRKSSKTKWDIRRRGELLNQLEVVQSRITQIESVSGLASADTAHLEATEAETEARRKYDAAETVRAKANEMALREYTHENEVYNKAKDYEKRSLDRIRTAMSQLELVLSRDVSQAKHKLDFLKRSAVNLDFMNAEEVETMRRKIASELSRNITGEPME